MPAPNTGSRPWAFGRALLADAARSAHRLNAPKYNPPRTWTPKGTIGHGGAITCIYPDQTPGGYQIFARTPMPIWDREQRLAAFKDSLALFRAGDRVRFVPIDRAEWDEIDAKVTRARTGIRTWTTRNSSIGRYRAWLAEIAPVPESRLFEVMTPGLETSVRISRPHRLLGAGISRRPVRSTSGRSALPTCSSATTAMPRRSSASSSDRR